MLSQNIKSYASLVLELLAYHETLKAKNQDNFYSLVRQNFENILESAIVEGKSNASLVDQIASSFLQALKPKKIIKKDEELDEQTKGKFEYFEQMFKE